MKDSTSSIPDMKIRVSFSVLVNGKEIDFSYLIKSINVSCEYNKIAWSEIVLLDGDVAKGDFTASNSENFAVGNEIVIEAGYDEKNKIIFKGVILKHAIKTGNEGSIVIVTAKHKAYKMAVKRNSTIYSDMTDSDIFSYITSNHNLKVTSEETSVKHESLTQYNTSDWDFLNMRAEANAMLVCTKDEEIIIHQPNLDDKEILEINYGSTIFDFEAEIDGRTSFTDYKATSWNFTEQKIDEVEEKNNLGETPQGNMPASELSEAVGNETCELTMPIASNDPGVLSKLLNSRILLNNLSRITGSVRIHGIADVYPGDIINLQRLGNRFNGKTLVSSVEHRIENASWFTILRFGLEASVYARKYDDVEDLKASGALAAVHGLQIGKVVKIDEDPLGEDRIMISFPHFKQGEDTFWARVATIDAGNERGICFRPEIDDEVIVGFINDHPNSAIILGMLHSSSMPSPLNADNRNPLKGIYTREKIKLEFDDEKKSLSLETPGSNKLFISDEEKGISLEDQNGNKIIMNGDGITIESAKTLNIKAASDVTIEGANVNIKAQATLKAEGSSGTEVSSSGNTVIKGTMVLIN